MAPDPFTREAVGLCPECGAGWTGSPCPACGYTAPVPADFEGRPFAPVPAPRDEAREFATFLPFTADRLQAAKEALLDAQKCCDECHQSVSAAIAPYMAAASPVPRDEAREDAYNRIMLAAGKLWAQPVSESNVMEFSEVVTEALAAALRADLSGPMQFGRDFMLEDLWAAYRQGAKEMRELAVILTRRDLPVDAEIERACDAYVKLIVGRVAAAPRADPTQTQVNAAADVLRFHEHWNMLPLDAEAWIVARKMLDAARLPESKQSDDWQTIKAECDSWWIAAIAEEAAFVVTRIRKRVEAYAAARAPGRTE